MQLIAIITLVGWVICSELGSIEGATAGGKSGATIVGDFSYGGRTALGNGTNFAKFRELLDLPETVQLRNVALEKIASFLPGTLRPGSTNPELTRLIRPLLDDVTEVPSIGQAVRFAPNETAQWFWAFHLPSQDRAELWRSNLWTCGNLLGGSAPEKLKSPGLTGWQLAGTNGHNFAVGTVDNWAVVTFGKHLPETNLSLFAKMAKLKHDSSAADNILALQFKKGTDWIDQTFLGNKGISEVNFSVHPRSGNLRSEVTVKFAEDQKWLLEPWRIPTNTISEPLISFTAIQNLSGWLAGSKLLKPLALAKMPNQAFMWSQSFTFFSLFAATHVPDSTNVISRFVEKVMTNIITADIQSYGGDIRWMPELSGAFWHGLPMIVPYIRPGEAGDSNFVVAGLFQTSAEHRAPPPALIEQVVSRTNLVFYDWEVSTPKVIQWSQLFRLISEIQYRPSRPAERPAESWLQVMGPKLGNTITEASVVSPRELSIVRRSAAGLSSLELVALARWIEHSNFPNFAPDFWLEPKKEPKKASP